MHCTVHQPSPVESFTRASCPYMRVGPWIPSAAGCPTSFWPPLLPGQLIPAHVTLLGPTPHQHHPLPPNLNSPSSVPLSPSKLLPTTLPPHSPPLRRLASGRAWCAYSRAGIMMRLHQLPTFPPDPSNLNPQTLNHKNLSVAPSSCTSQASGLGLARCAYPRADVMLLDDPLSAVDPKVASHLFDQCIGGPTAIMRGTTRLLVTHQVGRGEQSREES